MKPEINDIIIWKENNKIHKHTIYNIIETDNDLFICANNENKYSANYYSVWKKSIKKHIKPIKTNFSGDILDIKDKKITQLSIFD